MYVYVFRVAAHGSGSGSRAGARGSSHERAQGAGGGLCERLYVSARLSAWKASDADRGREVDGGWKPLGAGGNKEPGKSRSVRVHSEASSQAGCPVTGGGTGAAWVQRQRYENYCHVDGAIDGLKGVMFGGCVRRTGISCGMLAGKR
ncbi:hypothetical protein NDU88_004773 [Pleurodeles waltl]|uniref:Uncharacterized protein n=1 Tax=Pleurodeles waltl TaxID=8319 RepID=A0AAV7TS61_PLEWA|nr:hypothetical protein NDU88_004773 [Pleurodeles waltl]